MCQSDRPERPTRLIRATFAVQAASSVPVAGCRCRCCDVLLPRKRKVLENKKLNIKLKKKKGIKLRTLQTGAVLKNKQQIYQQRL